MEILLSIAASALAAGALTAAITSLRAARHWQARCESQESSIAALRREVELAASISVRMVRRVQRVEQEFSCVAQRVDEAETRRSPAAESLDLAIDLARRGADSGRLERQFGLSRAEADLVARLHGRSRMN